MKSSRSIRTSTPQLKIPSHHQELALRHEKLVCTHFWQTTTTACLASCSSIHCSKSSSDTPADSITSRVTTAINETQKNIKPINISWKLALKSHLLPPPLLSACTADIKSGMSLNPSLLARCTPSYSRGRRGDHTHRKVRDLPQYGFGSKYCTRK